MPLDNRRITGPENVLSPTFFQKEVKPSALVNEDKLRMDNRKLDEFRPLMLKVGVGSEATGSAYIEIGNTKILCSVYGPRDVLRRSDFSTKGQLYCEFKYAPYSCKVRQPHMSSSEEKSISLSIQQALESVVLLHKFPKARVDIFLLVLQNDGGVVGGALTCAGAALSNAGVEMYDLVVGCSIRQYGAFTIMDPQLDEEILCEKDEINHGKITLGMMPSYNQIVMLIQDGEVEISTLSKCIKDLMSTCQKLLPVITLCLRQAVEETEKNAGIELLSTSNAS